MLFPERWQEIHGFTSALFLPNVFPRYFHFIIACLAITGVFLAYWFGRKSYSPDIEFQSLNKQEIKKQMLNLALLATLAQFIFGPLLFLTLPAKGVNWLLFWTITAGVIVAIFVLFRLWKMIQENSAGNKSFYLLFALLTLLVSFMATGRHIYRENALKNHKELMAQRTAKHWEEVRKAHAGIQMPDKTGTPDLGQGEQLFKTNCAVCHHASKRLVGPPMAELTPIYKNNAEDLKSWIKKPGRKRMDYPPMTGFPQLTDEQLTSISTYVLEEDWN